MIIESVKLAMAECLAGMDHNDVSPRARRKIEAALTAALQSAADTPASQEHLGGEPAAWLTKIYSNDGTLIDTRLDFVKPRIGSTAKTEFVALYPAPQPNAEAIGYLKPKFPEAIQPLYIDAAERTEDWQRQVFTVPVYAVPSPQTSLQGLPEPDIYGNIPSPKGRHDEHDSGQPSSAATQPASDGDRRSEGEGASGDASRYPGLVFSGRAGTDDQPIDPGIGHRPERLSTPSPQPNLRVKPLEWKNGYRDAGCKITQVSPVPFYQIRELEGVVWLDIDNHQTVYPTVDEAKAAAQADYERTVLAALLPSPQPKLAGEDRSTLIAALQEWSDQKYGAPFSISACNDLLDVLPRHHVRVKPLEWQNYEARSATGHYRVQRLDEKWEPLHDGYYMLPKQGGVVSAFDTIDEAKAYAQADYERRILSALASPAPQPRATGAPVDNSPVENGESGD